MDAVREDLEGFAKPIARGELIPISLAGHPRNDGGFVPLKRALNKWLRKRAKGFGERHAFNTMYGALTEG